MKKDIALAPLGWQGSSFTSAGITHATYRKGAGPGVVVVHENRGLNPYIEDVARRLAKAGFIAFAPDALWPLGGYPGNDDDGRAMQRSLQPEKIVADLKAAAQWLKQLDGSSGKLGVVGFCFGGAMTGRLAAELPDIVDAGVPIYGSPPAADSIGNIKAPLLVQLGELDERVNAMWPAAEALFKQHNEVFFTAPAFMDKLSGTDQLRLQIEQGLSQAEIRASVARIGGEEFAILGTADELPEALALALLNDIRTAAMPHGAPVTVSIGIADGPVHAEDDWLELYRQADRALYEAKQTGRNRAVSHAALPSAEQAAPAQASAA